MVFTSGGTEAANTILTPGFRRTGETGPAILLLGATEHPCVLDGHRFARAEHIPVDRDGLVDLAWLDARLPQAREGVLVSIQTANNETGVVQPVRGGGAARPCPWRPHPYGRGPGRRQDPARHRPGSASDAVTLSAHKLGGPKGIGAIILASDRLEIADRLVRGGGQERGYRAGTENVAAIAGFGESCRNGQTGGSARRPPGCVCCERGPRPRFSVLAPEVVIFGGTAERLPNTFAFAVPGLKAETALIAFDLEGVALSSGSACSSGKVKRSHVLEAMGVEPRLAEGALRVSLGWNSTEEDVLRFAKACETVFATLYKRRASAA